MRIGINSSFLRKPDTGIGQVSVSFLRTLVALIVNDQQYSKHEFFLYGEEDPQLSFTLPKNVILKNFLPWWKRDDVLRKWLWERQVAGEARRDHCDAFLSLYQSATVFSLSRLSSETEKHPQQKNIRHTMVVHDIIPRFFSQYQKNFRQAWYWNRVERGIVHTDHIIAVSQHTKKDIIRELCIPEHTITVSYPDVAPYFRMPVTESAMDAVFQKYGLSEGYLYHGGGLEIRKNTETVLRAYAILRAQHLDVPPLVISGKIFPVSNALATDVRGLIQELGLQEYVQLLGYVSDADMPALYKGARVFVYPSLYEGFGLPVLEALCVGVPTVTSPVSSLPEVGGDAVLYAHPRDVVAVARTLGLALYDVSVRERLMAGCAARIALFRWDTFVKKSMDLLCPLE